MKPTTFSPLKTGAIILFAALCIGLISWDKLESSEKRPGAITDTVPAISNREKKVRNLDEVIAEMENADHSADFERVNRELADALKDFDGKKIALEVDKAIKELDLAKIQQEVQASLAKVDWNSIKVQMTEAIKELDMAKIEQQVNDKWAKTDWEKIKKELAKVKEIDMKKLEADMKELSKEMKELGPELKIELEKAKSEIDKAKVDMKEYRAFEEGLESDGLIDRKSNYSLEHRNGELLLNSKKVSDGVYSKYSIFLRNHPRFKISKSDDDFDINID